MYRPLYCGHLVHGDLMSRGRDLILKQTYTYADQQKNKAQDMTVLLNYFED